MAFREVSVSEIREVLRLWLGWCRDCRRPGCARSAGIAGWTARRCVVTWRPPRQLGLPVRTGWRLDDGLIGAVAEAVRPVRPRGHGAAWEQLLGFEKQISDWVAGTEEQRPLTVTKIHTPAGPSGCGAVSDVAPLRL